MTEQSRRDRRKISVPRTLLTHASGVVVALVVAVIAFSILSDRFLTASNLYSVVRQGACLALASYGMTLAILSAGIDLSVGSVIGLSTVAVGLLMQRGFSIPMMVLGGLLVGGACGLVNGLLISYLRLPPFVATFGMMGMAQGCALVLTDGGVIWGFSQAFGTLANGSLGSVPMPLVVVALVGIALHVMLKYTPFGTSIYAIGGHEEAASLSGIRVARNKALAYGISGFLAGASGVMMASRMNSAMAIYGAGYEFDAIAATVVGGTSLSGGRGSIAGTLVGTAFVSILRNGLNLAGVGTYWQVVAIGAIIVIAFVIDRIRR